MRSAEQASPHTKDTYTYYTHMDFNVYSNRSPINVKCIIESYTDWKIKFYRKPFYPRHEYFLVRRCLNDA